MSNVENKVIVETLVPEGNRLATLPRIFGPQHMMAFESRVYHWMRELTEGSERPYTGGLWDYYTLSNGGFYMAPALDGEMTLTSPSGNSGKMSVKAAGITASLYAVNSLCCHTQIEKHVQLYYHLREFALDHEEWRPIARVID